jgi:glutamate formiminotransferase
MKDRMRLIESIPNVSEGRRADVIERLAGAIRQTPGARLLDHSADPSHNRSVFTVAGEPAPVVEAVLALFAVAISSIDLRTHTGEHPRIGAVDVVPFVPLEGATMDDCVSVARQVGAAVAARFAVPVYLYEQAAADRARQKLEDVRRGGFEALGGRMAGANWRPDFGPDTPHSSAGASAIGARRPLIAYNINLATNRLDIARAIAAAIRESSGGFKYVKAAGFTLAHRGIVQVSMNLTNYEQTSIFEVFDAVQREARRHGVAVLESEIIGLVPAAALVNPAAIDLQLARFGPEQILENRLRDTQ